LAVLPAAPTERCPGRLGHFRWVLKWQALVELGQSA